ncbi:hypothetical protein CC78DRAFT_612811, partial [Lojkania enalia]
YLDLPKFVAEFSNFANVDKNFHCLSHELVTEQGCCVEGVHRYDSDQAIC